MFQENVLTTCKEKIKANIGMLKVATKTKCWFNKKK